MQTLNENAGRQKLDIATVFVACAVFSALVWVTIAFAVYAIAKPFFL